MRNPFIAFDDETYVTRNIHVQSGVSWKTDSALLTSTQQSNWHPLTWLSHALDCQLYGMNPAGKNHFTSLFIHTLKRPTAFPVAAEGYRLSMAELAGGGIVRCPSFERGIGGLGRRAQECAQHILFFLCARRLWLVCTETEYQAISGGRRIVRFGSRREAHGHYFAFHTFAAGLLAIAESPKLGTVARPLAGTSRMQQTKRESFAPPLTFPALPLSRLLLEKLPLLLFSAGSAVITVIAQRTSAIRSLTQIPLD